jgi:hypothetical protein
LKSKFIEAMDLLQAEAKKGDLSLGQVMQILGDESHPILLMFFALPYMIPISIPGLSTPSGIVIGVLAVNLYFQRPPWMPKKIANKRLSAETVTHISESAEKFWKKMAHWVRERWVFFYDLPVFKFINVSLLILNAVLLSLPLPIPLSNTMPGIAILLCSLGHLEKDGLFIFCSYLWTLLVIGFFLSIPMGARYFF